MLKAFASYSSFSYQQKQQITDEYPIHIPRNKLTKMNTQHPTYAMKKVQYTIRSRSAGEGKSLNSVAAEALTLQTLSGTDAQKACQDIFNRLCGSKTLDDNFDTAIKNQSKPGQRIWH